MVNARSMLSILATALVLVLVGCETVTTPEQRLRQAVSEVLPDLGSFELVKIDDASIIERLEEHAIVADGPIYVDLPVVDPDGKLDEAYTFTVYAHDMRLGNGGVPVLGVSDPDVKEDPLDPLFLSGPSLTFQGLPLLYGSTELQYYADQASEGKVFEETELQVSVVNVLSDPTWGQELEAAYYGPSLAAPSVLQGLRSILVDTFGEKEVESWIAEADLNYLVYNHANYARNLEHLADGEKTTQIADDGHDHSHDVASSDEAQSALAPSSHFGEQGTLATITLVPVADDTIYDPDTGTWLRSGWFSRMEAAVNRMDVFGTWTNMHPDGALGENGNRFALRARIGEFRVLTESGKDRLVPHPADGCGGAGSYRDEIRKMSGTGNPSFDNEYWMWVTGDTSFSGGGCSYTQVIDLTPRGASESDVAGYCDGSVSRTYGECGSVGYVEWASADTTDWTSLVVIHESGHALYGLHDTDARGNTGEPDNSQQCLFLGAFPIGPTGPSVMSYAGGTPTYCFAWETNASATSSIKNVPGMASWLHGVLDLP